jgi:hypothetical protein
MNIFALALSIFLLFFQPSKPLTCEVVPIAFIQHGVVEPHGQQQFWSVVQNCSDRIVKYKYTVTLLREGKPIGILAVKNVVVMVGEAVTSVTEFEAESMAGNYTCVVTVTAQGKSAFNSADFIVQ